jgi:cytochrome c oxidase subunit II
VTETADGAAWIGPVPGSIDTRSEYDSLAGLYLPIAIAVAALVFGAMGFALIRYRRRPGRAASTRTELPVVEGLYALILAGIAAVLIAATFSTESKVDSVASDPATRVDVTAFQWGWRFTYPGTGVTVVGDQNDPPMLTVPTGETVQFRLTSHDVIHAFWIPELRFKRDAFPARETTFDLVFDEDTIGRCAEFCGLHHSGMTFDVAALAPDDFSQWLRESRRR